MPYPLGAGAAQPMFLVDPVTGNAVNPGAGGGGGGATADGGSDSGATTSVASTTSAQTLKAANTARYGLTISNTDANVLYVLLGAGTVSAALFTVQIASGGYYEVPYGFTGIVTGIWAADGAGVALVTEIT